MIALSHVAPFILLALLLSPTDATRRSVRNICLSPLPVQPHNGTGCGIPVNMDAKEFGDNSNSIGKAIITPRRRGLDISIIFKNLSKPNLVLTAWIIWHLPGDPTVPKVFKIADHASPLAPWTASFSSGMSGVEPNQLRYTSPTTAKLFTRLNFNPSYPNEGPLTRFQFAFQKDVPGIQNTQYRMYEIPASGGKFVPTSSDYLRRYDKNTGWEILGSDGRPVIVRSPLKAMGIAVAAHIDKTTHGISPGFLGVDHFEIGGFPLERIGRRTWRG